MDTINLHEFSKYLSALKNTENYDEKNTIADFKLQSHWREKIYELVELLPHGNGIDEGVKFDYDNSTPEKLIFTCGFHHMDQNGYYSGWTYHNLTITPSLQFGFKMKISGKNKNDIKAYLYDLFDSAFTLKM